MRRFLLSQTLRLTLTCTFASVVFLSMAQFAAGQDTPIITGGVAYLGGTTKGTTVFTPTIMPVIALPITNHFLFESRSSLVEAITPGTGGKSERTKLNRNIIYLQMDYLANSHMTFVAGKFLTPFNTYNERLAIIWINNFQTAPLSFPIGNIGTAGTGGEVRGSVFANDKVNIDYTAFVSGNVTAPQFGANRATGGRFEAYLPSGRFEIGTSYVHMFEGAHRDASGFHVWWQPAGGPLYIRSEYSHSTHSQGYWVETSYRLSQFGGQDSPMGRLQPVFRMQQTFRNSPDATDGLPSANTQMADFGLDYFLPHEVRINTSYSREFSSTGNGNVWKTGVIYRFLIPTWRGK